MYIPYIGEVPIPRLFDLPEDFSLMLIGEILFVSIWAVIRILFPKIFKYEKKMFDEIFSLKIPLREKFFAALLDKTAIALLATATYSSFVTFFMFIIAFQPFNKTILILSIILLVITLTFFYLALKIGEKKAFEYVQLSRQL
ncbi:MAG: hypothetical protein DRJ35_06880 [Thermoprotei archaeon]|nr:MAG: hypothetical protein DRJ35_06880 [Thermoprotei archaeon]